MGKHHIDRFRVRIRLFVGLSLLWAKVKTLLSSPSLSSVYKVESTQYSEVVVDLGEWGGGSVQYCR